MARKEKVTRVIDGDTFETASRKHPVRLANVDAPELKERGGKAAKAALNKLIGGKDVSIDTKARDKFARAVADVKVGRQSVNRAMQNRGKRK